MGYYFCFQFFPETLQIVGRIAHAQVWDYLDKLKCSTTKVRLVLCFFSFYSASYRRLRF